MGDRVRPLTSKEVEKVLSRYGFVLISQKGSHRKWRNLDSGRQVIVPFHSGRNLPIGTLGNILVNAEIPEVEWKG
jgi:predicted RNA binding protein YcfA (HicA-like mRNA interferase family)